MYSVFPFNKIEKESKIIIYGAGIAGRNYFNQINALQYCEVMFLVDRDYKNIHYADIEVKSIEDIFTAHFDFIVISILNYKVKISIKEELVSRGVPAEKIVAVPAAEFEWDDFSVTNVLKELSDMMYASNLPILNYLSGGFQGEITAKLQRSVSTALLHQKTFGGYKNMYNGKNMVLVGAGPSVNDFIPIPDAVYVGLNRAFLFKKVIFDYLFSVDKAGIADYYEDFFDYRKGSCIKFIGDQNLGIGFQIPESLLVEEDIRQYKTTAGYMPNKCTLDIASEPLGNYESVSLQAMQFMLYTNPSRIYLVGIDCSAATKGHFVGRSYHNDSRNEDIRKNDDMSVKSWQEMKDFADLYYPDVEIISVNPVGLKGIFRDLYQ